MDALKATPTQKLRCPLTTSTFKVTPCEILKYATSLEWILLTSDVLEAVVITPRAVFCGIKFMIVSAEFYK